MHQQPGRKQWLNDGQLRIGRSSFHFSGYQPEFKRQRYQRNGPNQLY
jgi:hypothetical protein